ncbi:preprotein translocase subunit SecA [uncultured Kiloniella sp.]|uniref:preprotein translocase subunit SecA n=1 Tax=uncultured Kiloniella sp. TaxID=1133091 RepID=UPI00260B1519|nr:preprotein translocase subunit SecA [uncultured Kiloniella sp.]
MLGALVKRMFGSANDRYLKGLNSIVLSINSFESKLETLSDDDLKGQTENFRNRLKQGETLEDILPEAFATVREASRRTLGLRHFDVQMMGGIVLHRGMISEMATGEGKTLVATLPVYLNAIEGKGVHVVTVNDYLAKRDAEWMGQIYRFLGLTVGCVFPGQGEEERAFAYTCDITYATNNELGFDYLRDNMKFEIDQMVQREFNYAIVDEVDSILIDEARTPLIISGPAENSSESYITINKYVPFLTEEHYELDEKTRSVTLTDEGVDFIEKKLMDDGVMQGSLYEIENVSTLHHINQALKAHKLFQRDKDYIVKDNKVVIIDEFTGRMMEGRRFSEGLHQALEAKENAEIQNENQTLASITFQNYFRLYPKLAGMTGTAMTEAEEFSAIYGLDVISMTTNLPCIRIDHDDEVYRTGQERDAAIIKQIKECHERQQPVLVGTVTIEKSEYLAALLQKEKIEHKVLNARYHEQEAMIVAQAGSPGAVTIATNMAGRGTDIKLGGNEEMRIEHETLGISDDAQKQAKAAEIAAEIAANKEIVNKAGGLFMIGSERHESRRIDNQLRGRSGRQSDPGASKFFLSLEDDLMRIFGSERMDSMLQKLGLEDGEAIIHPWVNKALEKAQKKVEARNFEIRKNILKFDDVMNDQRKVIYEQRKEVMSAEEVKDTVASMRHEVLEDLVTRTIPANAYSEQWELDSLHEECMRLVAMDLPVKDWAEEEGIADQEILDRILQASNEKMAAKTANYGPEVMRSLEKQLLLMVLDKQWKEHLLSLDHLKQAVGLRAYGQKNPLDEYKREAFEMFESMLDSVRDELTMLMHRFELQTPEDATVPRQEQEMHESRQDPAVQQAGATTVQAKEFDQNDPSTWGKTSRNAPCPCGSGKKYKHCHGKLS